MLKFNKHCLLSLAFLLMTACQTGPEKSVPKPVAPEAAASEAVTESPAPQPAAEDFNQQFYEEAVAALKSGDAKLAVDLLQQVSFDAPDKPFVFTNLGLAYLKLQQPEEAEQAFLQAIERNGRDAVAHNHLGILQRQKGKFEDARKRYQRAIDIDSDYARAHLNLGILFDIYLQDLDKALRQYQKYQTLTNGEDTQVAGWIVDIERRLKSATSKSQG